MKSLRYIHCVNEIKWVQKVGKYIVTMEFRDFPKQTFWVSEKQAEKLSKCVEKVGDYSNKEKQIYAVITDDKYFAWCGTHSWKYSEIPFLCGELTYYT